ncbi:MAG: transcriptional repressor LexA [Melioribacteraceae bacterium]|nr:MAG: transcriptional repressor LexA [Melioribacteraceae bacterium]
MKAGLTKIQKQILDFIIDNKSNFGMPPTLAEIANHFKYKNRATVQQHLKAIERKGYLKRNPKISRGIELTLDEKFFIPRPVIGEAAAGNPLVVYPDSIDTIQLPTIARIPKESFLVKVKGDSLKDAYIFNGDIVIVDPSLQPKNGDLSIIVLDDSAVVKRFFKKANSFELHSENPDYDAIVVDIKHHNFRIVGVVIGIYRVIHKKVI